MSTIALVVVEHVDGTSMSGGLLNTTYFAYETKALAEESLKKQGYTLSAHGIPTGDHWLKPDGWTNYDATVIELELNQ